jgi:hypothetical protein
LRSRAQRVPPIHVDHHSSLAVEQHPLHRPGPRRQQVLLHEVTSHGSVMVSVTLIFEAFEHVANNYFLIMKHFLGNYTFFLISPWWLSLCPSKLVTLGKRVVTGWFLEGSLYHSHPYLPPSILLPLYFLIFWVSGLIDPRRDCTSFHGKKGLKAQRCCSWKKIKSNVILLDAHPQVLGTMKCFSKK